MHRSLPPCVRSEQITRFHASFYPPPCLSPDYMRSIIVHLLPV
jgi:hypothetical protein